MTEGLHQPIQNYAKKEAILQNCRSTHCVAFYTGKSKHSIIGDTTTHKHRLHLELSPAWSTVTPHSWLVPQRENSPFRCILISKGNDRGRKGYPPGPQAFEEQGSEPQEYLSKRQPKDVNCCPHWKNCMALLYQAHCTSALFP